MTSNYNSALCISLLTWVRSHVFSARVLLFLVRVHPTDTPHVPPHRTLPQPAPRRRLCPGSGAAPGTRRTGALSSPTRRTLPGAGTGRHFYPAAAPQPPLLASGPWYRKPGWLDMGWWVDINQQKSLTQRSSRISSPFLRLYFVAKSSDRLRMHRDCKDMSSVNC